MSFIYRTIHILAAMYPRPMNMVTNVSLGSGLSSDVPHMKIIQVVHKRILMKTLKNIEKYTSVYEICLKSVPESSCSCFFCFQKRCEDRGQDQQKYPTPQFLDISPKSMCWCSQLWIILFRLC